MVIVIEIDRRYCGFGFMKENRIVGIYLGFLAIHFISAYIDEFVQAWNDKKSRGE